MLLENRIHSRMPLLDLDPYRSPLYCRGPHLETIFPNVIRRRFWIRYTRERVELKDGDFIDVDIAKCKENEISKRCLLTLHGLEGSSSAPYVKSMIVGARGRGYDVVAMNMRGCSGEINRLARFYHSGETGDLREVIEYLSVRYESIGLVGFSLGGNVVLKYLGESPESVSSKVLGAVAFSAPVDLAASANRISEPSNRFYMKRFIRMLADKVERKSGLYPESIDPDGCREMQTFLEFDGKYTAPLNGFASAMDYWTRCSSANWLSDIRTPALLVNARNDPFLAEACFPESVVAGSEFLYGVFPEFGGHMGFPSRRIAGACWHEKVGLDFLEEKSR